MLRLVNWCNQNEGFVMAIFSLLTLITSIVAVWFSYTAIRLQYRKKLFVTPCLYMQEDRWVIDVLVTNLGTVPVLIRDVSITNNKHLVMGFVSTGSTPFALEPHKCKTYTVPISDGLEIIEEHGIDLNNHIRVVVKEHGGKSYVWRKGFPVG